MLAICYRDPIPCVHSVTYLEPHLLYLAMAVVYAGAIVHCFISIPWCSVLSINFL